MTSWRGSKSSSWSLMAHLWRSEEADILVSRGHLGTLEGMHSTPLNGPVVLSVHKLTYIHVHSDHVRMYFLFIMNPPPSHLPPPLPPSPSADMRHPLVGAAQRTEQETTEGERLGSSCVPPSVKDVTNNLRARIFSLCSKIGERAPSLLLSCSAVQFSTCVTLLLVVNRVPVLSSRHAYRGQGHLVRC